MMKMADMPDDDLHALLKAARLTACEKLDQLSEAERQELKEWLQQNARRQEWHASFNETANLAELNKQYAAFKAVAVKELEALHRQQSGIPSPVLPVPFFRRAWTRYAAAVLLLLAGAWYFWPAKSPERPKQASIQPIEVMPGQDGAILTLADGSQIRLDSSANGVVARQGSAVLSVNNGQLRYKAAGEASVEETFNTLTTPKGRQFRIQLPDGTTAWLNAASSIRFPTQFANDARRVDITGEVYFEAASMMKDGKPVPFLVNADNKFEVTVLGTHFNVNAYADEPALNTTLLEGKVAVAVGKQKLVLKPGDQASLIMRGKEAGKMTVKAADIGKALAWKNGVFDFEDARIDEVMRQLKRWYDIDVKYESGVPDIEFVGKMTRDIPLNGLLIALEKSNVHFRLEGRTLIVMP
ncbi:ferric-dicitrate binding protein FerR (iron transport regulator) [Chitinophaga terrae (ex Kim and Jung 2007)]|uniref:FecR family protein n=1 Tax=Chitinophaga terrae (ex Kim and Jung 2007) TaxID=408074 RepID=UPI00278050F3|nr:FecR family protein [Chitinophaga terrae (ex Kim and Jung 2007)]MDQ0110211.1 ferric-dicitrate binding protein FerR (iron transport regulator) [Chitinophaga terrae (ex Kim and Jung 2007)]